MLARVGIAHWQNIGHHIVPPPKKKNSHFTKTIVSGNL